jgi:hypothetical protein
VTRNLTGRTGDDSLRLIGRLILTLLAGLPVTGIAAGFSDTISTMQDLKQSSPGEHDPKGFLSFYLGELKALSSPALPLLVTGSYCLFVSLAYYYRQGAYQMVGAIVTRHSIPHEAGFIFAYGMEGLWYFLAPCVAVFSFAIVARAVPATNRVLPLCSHRDFGLSIGESCGWRDSAIFLIIALPIVIIATFSNDFSSCYPLAPLARTSVQWFVVWEAIQLLYFFGWEFLNRGFLLMGLETAMGRWSILAAAVPFCILHFGKPGPETFVSYFVAIALGWLTLRSRSILPATVIHWAWTLALDTAVVIHKG